jgi:hypothetical protein
MFIENRKNHKKRQNSPIAKLSLSIAMILMSFDLFFKKYST